jgi:ubiquinone/menaquinone biosynthesis C-methylase UbiE
MEPSERARRASSFAGVAAEYDRGRPGYPPQAIDWILGSDPLEVLDLGAGTGKLTDAVIAAGHDVVAVEPLAEMRAVLAARHPDLPVIEGTAERLPLPDGAVDAVVVGAAFHWFEQEAALAEIVRVLRPPGVLGLLGNTFATDRAWAAELRGILGEATHSRPGHWPDPDRARRLDEIDGLWQRTPELAGRSDAEMQWVTQVRRWRGPISSDRSSAM